MECFTHLPQYQVMVCNECHYAVLPSQVDSHLSSPKHRLPPRRRREIQNEIQTWPQLFATEADLEELNIPHNAPPPFEQLSLYTDGRKCHLCNHVVRTDEGIQRHCRVQHGWVNNWKKGRKAADRKRAGLSVNRPWAIGVCCQRFFTHGRRQEYFEVQGSQEDIESPASLSSKWEQARAQLTEKWTAMKEIERRTIQEGQADEVNPWLERTGWLPYLKNFDRDDLLKSVSRPDEDDEPVNAAIWQTMDELVRCCQDSVIHKAGIFVRMEAIRDEKHHSRYTPLQPYMDAAGLAKYARPWKQVLMFIARTQEPHDWDSPPYQLTTAQATAWETFVCQVKEMVQEQQEEQQRQSGRGNGGGRTDQTDQEDRPVMTGIHKACLQFCFEILDHRITQHEYDSVLICALAVLGVRLNGWMGVDQYPPLLSEVIKVSRFMVVQLGFEFEERKRENSDVDGQDGPRVGCLDSVTEMMDRFMVRGTHTPMQWMLDLRTYGLKIHYNTTTEGFIDWQGDLIMYKQIQFTMGQFRGMVHGLVAETRRILQTELMFTRDDAMPAIPWRQLRDNPVNRQPGWNFTQDTRTPFPVDGAWWLFNRIGQNKKLQRRFQRSGPLFAWNKWEVQTYMAQVMRFRENLLVLMHITGGQPACAPEILSIRYSNTARGGHRNIFIENGMVVFVTRYHKGYSISGNMKIIHRYLPREVGALWVWYMWLVLPLQQKLEVDIWQKKEMSSHMWPPDPDGKKWTSDRMTKVIRRESVAGMGVALGILSYRNLSVAISRQFLRGRYAFERNVDHDDDEEYDEHTAAAVAALQTGHTLPTEGKIYARGIEERDGEIESMRALYRESSITWQRFLGFPDDSIGGADTAEKKRKGLPFEEEYGKERVDRALRLRQIDIHQMLKQIMGPTAEFRGVQEAALQAIMAGKSPVVAVMGTGAGKSLLFMLPAFCSGLTSDDGGRGISIVVVPLIALREELQQRCQALGIECAEWNLRQPPDGAQVVLVTPESALSDSFRQFLRRVQKMQQLDRIVIDECHMVLNNQMNFRKKLQELGELTGVGVQMICLTATLPPSKEATLWQRMGFDAAQVQLFRDITRRTNIRYAVIKLNRSNHRRNNTETATSQAGKQDQVVKMIQQKIRKSEQGKTVVYCNSVPKMKELAEALSCEAYHHDAEDKVAILERFRKTNKGVVVATSALGMGIDIPDIRVIWHVDPPRRLLDYAQESGRAGRDGVGSEALTVVGWDGGDYGEPAEEVRLVQRFIGEECRRAVLSEYLDGARQECQVGEEACDHCAGGDQSRHGADDRGVDGAELAGENEQRGLAKQKANEPAARQEPAEEEENRRERVSVQVQLHQQKMGFRRNQEQTKRDGIELEALERQLIAARGKCPSCVAQGIVPNDHLLFRCEQESSKRFREVYEQTKNAIRRERTMAKYSGCMTCFLPQAWCNQWEQSERKPGMYQRKKGETCEYQDVVLSGVIVGLERAEGMVQRMASDRFNVDQHGDIEKYWGQRRVWGGLETSVLLREFYLMGRE